MTTVQASHLEILRRIERVLGCGNCWFMCILQYFIQTGLVRDISITYFKKKIIGNEEHHYELFLGVDPLKSQVK